MTICFDANTDFIVKKPYKRMMILHNFFEFSLPVKELVNIYILTWAQLWNHQHS